MSSARQGFFWWEVDLTYYALRVLAWIGLVWDVREPTAASLGGPLEKSAADIADPAQGFRVPEE